MPPERTPGARPGSSWSSRWSPPVVWTGLILIGTSWPAVSVGPDDPIIGLDKAMHLVAYGVLTVLVVRALRPPLSLVRGLAVLAALSSFGAIDEWHQGFIPGRSTSIYDWVADTLGVILGLVASTYVLPRLAARDAREPNPSRAP